ncbi:response regulator [Cohnella pontilimi]|uniref:Circadian input-output histidine kinase CikA n=1 Tax=Cohnella pontilimi TaxID=2564100 RepID=A0A4U0FBX4_9BACL|nr:response regulator [Cohnella pontilimi]TJY42138.1 response regulator [Cohnella pontilimi]
MAKEQSVSILLVDDHVQNLMALEAALDGENYRFVRAASGHEALRHLLREEFAVIVMDVQMPEMDGFETARLIKSREKTKDTPILFISATSREAVDQFEGYSAGAIDYLIKPIVPSILKAKISAFVRMYLNNRELQYQRDLLKMQKEELLRATYRLTTAEAKSRMIFETSMDGIFTFDEYGRILSVNPAMERLFGYSANELIGTAVENVLPSIVLMRCPQTQEHDNMPLYLTGVVRESVAYRRNGTMFHAEIQLGKEIINTERLYACTVRDITELKGTLRQLRDAKNTAELASSVKSQFLAVMSHEIRTPMNGLIGMSELMLETAMTGEQETYAHAIKDNANRLLKIMDDILDFTNMESGKIELDEQPFSIRECLADVAACYEAEAARKNLELLWEMEEGVPEYVVGDPHRYRQILRHMLDNAVKFTDNGGVYVLVRARPGEGAGEPRIRLETSVQDTGSGIPDSLRHLLFMPFSQVDSSMTRKHGGTGLGLAVCQTLTKAMGGGMRLAESSPEGTRFVCRISVAPFEWPSEFPQLAVTANQEPRPDKAAIIVAKSAYRRRLLSMLVAKLGMTPRVTSCTSAAVVYPDGKPAALAIIDGYSDKDRDALPVWSAFAVPTVCIGHGNPPPEEIPFPGCRFWEGPVTMARLSALMAELTSTDTVQGRLRRV